VLPGRQKRHPGAIRFYQSALLIVISCSAEPVNPREIRAQVMSSCVIVALACIWYWIDDKDMTRSKIGYFPGNTLLKQAGKQHYCCEKRLI